MKILYYISGYDGCGYYRVQLVAKYLNRLPDVHARIVYQYDNNDIDWADVIVIQKQSNPKAIPYIQYAKKKGKKVVTEVDDDYFNIPVWNPAYKYYHNLGSELIAFYKLSDAMTVTTPHLRKEMLKYNPNVYVLPNSLDMEIQRQLENMDPQERAKHTFYLDTEQKSVSQEEVRAITEGKKLIGWGGSPTHLRDLDQATKALQKVCNENKDVMLIMMACSTDTLLKTIHPKQMLLVKPNPIFRYHQVLASMDWDIGICPIEDNIFNRSKSNLKFLEFAVNGYSCVCSDVENYSSTVKDGETGLLANNTTEGWYCALTKMLNYTGLRDSVSQNSKKFVAENYDISKNVNLWLDAYKKILGGK
jgi:glycosyltransferase involved in cell wall biosynthesis